MKSEDLFNGFAIRLGKHVKMRVDDRDIPCNNHANRYQVKGDNLISTILNLLKVLLCLAVARVNWGRHAVAPVNYFPVNVFVVFFPIPLKVQANLAIKC